MAKTKYSILDMRKIAKSKNGKCLSETYVNNTTKLCWQCEKRHEWWATPRDVKSGHWCAICAKNKKLDISLMQQEAQKHNGRCISKKYTNTSTKLEWECEKKHKWWATPRDIRSGKWCPECSGNQKLSLKLLNEIAIAKGGRCLSTRYINNKSKYLWQCELGHEWEAQANHVKNTGSWCPQCAGNARLTISDAQSFATKNNGKLLSKMYENNRTKLMFECQYGHIFYSSLDGNTWCPKCAGTEKLMIEDAQKFAREKGGKCLSRTYNGNKQPLLWQCSDGHQWEARFSHIKNSDSWCPQCSGTYTENKIRFILESLINHQFPTRKPKWLKNRSGNRMELDGFCEEIGLAFEYHGEQHTKINYLIETQKKLQKRISDDERKRALCKLNNVKLIEIYHFEIEKNLIEVILAKLKSMSFDMEPFTPLKEVNFLDFHKNTSKINALQEFAKVKNGKLLSTEYINNKTHLRWKCEKGHEWEASASSITNKGSWCPICYKNR